MLGVYLLAHMRALDIAVGFKIVTGEEITTLNCFNMRSKEEPTALLGAIKHLVDHICGKRFQKFNLRVD